MLRTKSKTHMREARALFDDHRSENASDPVISSTFPNHIGEPLLGESLLGYVARVGTANNRTLLSQVLRLAYPDLALGANLPFSDVGLQPLARLLDAPTGALEQMRYNRSADMAFARRTARLNENEVPRKFLSTGHRRISPKTLSQHGYHRAIWDLLPLYCCVESGERLIDRCSCGTILTWRTNDLTICGNPLCRVDLRDISPPRVSTEELEKIRFLGELFSHEVGLRRAAMARIPKFFFDLSTSDLLDLIILFGVARTDPLGLIAKRRRSSLCNGNFTSWEPSDLVGGIEVLLGFPKTFEELLDLTISRAADRPGRGSLSKYLGVLVELTEPKPFPESIVSKFKTLIPDSLNRREQIALNPRVKTTSPKYASDTISIREACKRHKLSYARIAALTPLPGFLKSENSGRGMPVLLDAGKVADAVQRFNELVSLSGAAAELGTTVPILRRLIAEGFIAVADGPEVAMRLSRSEDNGTPEYFLRRTLQEFVAAIESRAVALKEPARLMYGTINIPNRLFIALKGILRGKIAVGIDPKAHKPMHRLMVDESEFRSFACAEVENLEELVSMDRAKDILKLKWSVAKELLEKTGTKLIETNSFRTVKRVDVCRIAEKYISGGEAAELLGASARHLPAYLARFGVSPAIILQTRNAAFYDRHEFYSKAERLFVQPEKSRRTSKRKSVKKS